MLLIPDNSTYPQGVLNGHFLVVVAGKIVDEYVTVGVKRKNKLLAMLLKIATEITLFCKFKVFVLYTFVELLLEFQIRQIWILTDLYMPVEFLL
jgi:hypothetical protein